jgi:hypothetical protein
MPKATTEAARLERERIIGSRREEMHEETRRFFQSIDAQPRKTLAAVVNCERPDGKGARRKGLRRSSSRG